MKSATGRTDEGGSFAMQAGTNGERPFMRYFAALLRRLRPGRGRSDAVRTSSDAQAVAASVAQELRGPLARLQGSLRALQESLPAPGAAGEGPADAMYEQLARGEQALQQALQVVSMAQAQSRDAPVDGGGLRHLSAAEVVQQALEAHRLQGEDARERLAVQVAQDFTFLGDEAACLFVLGQLIANGLYHAGGPATRVTVTVGARQITVRDDGPGLAPELLRHLFDPLRPPAGTGGTGLGLAYCRRVVRAFGGELRCTSAQGGSTEFTLAFPPADAAEREEQRLAALAHARTMLAGRRVLIVADDASQRTGVRQKLGPLALTTELEEVTSGQAALARLAARKIDIVLLDLQLADLDGYRLAERIRRAGGSANENVRIVGWTSEVAAVARVKAARAGIDGVLPRGCGQARLLAALPLQLQPQGAGAHRGSAGRLAGRRVMVAVDSAFNRKAIAAHLRNAGVSVLEVEHGETVLEQLHAHDGVAAVIVDLHMPGMDGLATARAIRACREPWAGIPVLGLTARSDEPAVAAADAAGMNGILVKPVEAPLLYDTLARLLTAGTVSTAAVAAVASPVAAPQEGLLNLQRLESYRRLGMLDELLGDYVPEMTRLVRVLQEAVENADVQGSIAALHSLLGMSGEAGAQALYLEVRRLYVPLLEQGQWPRGSAWLPQLQELAARTEQALKAYCADQARSSAG